MALEPAVIDLAASHGGMVARRDLVRLGKSRQWIDREVAAGRLATIKPGFYRVFEMNGHLDLLRAAVLTLPKAVVSHQSAAHILHFPSLPPLIPTVTVHAKTTHRFPGVIVRRNTDLRSDHVLRAEGLMTTNTMRTVFDLAAVVSETRLELIIQELVIADRLELTRMTAFANRLRRKGKPGSRAVADVLERLTRGGRTRLEQLGLTLIRDYGLPEPKLEFEAPWDPDERIDAAWQGCRVGIEWDSRSWHGRLNEMASDRRRDRAAALSGWVILRYTWEDVADRPDSVADEIRTLLTSRTGR